MRYLILPLILFLSGCASGQIPGYISRVEHPYDKKMSGTLEKVTSAVIYVLKKNGWMIAEEDDPAVYERDDRYDNNSYQNVLIMTGMRRQNLVLYSTLSHLNVFIHAHNNDCDLEIRYESWNSNVVKQFTSVRNDKLVNGILDQIEQEVDH